MTDTSAGGSGSAGVTVIAVVAWLWVLLPFLYGVWQLLIKVVPLFAG